MNDTLQYTPVHLPTMTGPAWPDNTRTAIEISESKPTDITEDKNKNKKKKTTSTKKPVVSTSETADNSPSVADANGTTEEPQTQSGDIAVPIRYSSFQPARRQTAGDDNSFVENPVPEGQSEGNWFSRMIAPPKDELEAANNGLRWHWALEHRFMPPGSKWNETVWQGADRENLWLKNMLKQKNGIDLGIPNAAGIRAREQTRRAILDQYNKLLSEYQKGNWDDPQRAYEDFKKEAMRMREQYRKAGMEYGAEFDPEDLRLPPPVSGGRSTFTTQTRAIKHRDQWNYANDVNNKLAGWIASGKINDPKFMGSNDTSAYLDSAYETLVKYFKESSNAMADAEKQRLQILALPDEAYDEAVIEIQNFQKALAGIMSSASAKEWSQNNMGKVNQVLKAFGFDPKETSKGDLADKMWTLGGLIVSSLSRNDELPHDVAQDLEAAKTQFDTYMKNLMFAANVAPHIVANMAYNLAHTAKNQYNDQAFASGRGRADALGDIEDLTNKIPRNAMPVARLMKHTKYTYPSLAKDPQFKGKASTAPQSEGEANPGDAAEEVGGVELRF